MAKGTQVGINVEGFIGTIIGLCIGLGVMFLSLWFLVWSAKMFFGLW